jgi:uncharacterized protein (DUF983 family)
MARLRDLYLRALRLRCPACGGGQVFVSRFRMCPSCPDCGLHFDREPEGGYWVGSYTINLMATEAVFATALVTTLVVTWPTPPWDALTWGDALLMLTFPVFFFPWSKTLFIAIDLTFRPEEPGDHEEPREPAVRSSDRRTG